MHSWPLRKRIVYMKTDWIRTNRKEAVSILFIILLFDLIYLVFAIESWFCKMLFLLAFAEFSIGCRALTGVWEVITAREALRFTRWSHFGCLLEGNRGCPRMWCRSLDDEQPRMICLLNSASVAVPNSHLIAATHSRIHRAVRSLFISFANRQKYYRLNPWVGQSGQ